MLKGKCFISRSTLPAHILDRQSRIGHVEKPTICSSLYLLFFMSIIRHHLTGFSISALYDWRRTGHDLLSDFDNFKATILSWAAAPGPR